MPDKKLIECGDFEAGREARNRSLLDANEDFETEPDAKRAHYITFLEIEEGLGIIITNILYHLAEELYLARGE